MDTDERGKEGKEGENTLRNSIKTEEGRQKDGKRMREAQQKQENAEWELGREAV